MPQLQRMQQSTNNAGNSMMGGMNSSGNGSADHAQYNEPKKEDPIESSEE